jgi:diguanylate cyclase (GGDEF)-like protein
LESITGHITSLAFSLIGNNKGTCLLYLIDSQTHQLVLFKARKEDHDLVIRAKEGDIFDSWVLRHTSPLIIEDIKKDFRFDLDKLRGQDIRPISSLVSAPLISEHKFLGLLRLDNHQPSFYAQDDLRFLVTLSDIGAVAVENGQLFQKTQDLAIHDGLTLLFTKAHFLDLLKDEYKRSVRQNKTFSLFMLDIDYFKNYNDKFGHTAGDIVLKNLSQAITEALKSFNPLICRFGGEEFCILLPLIGHKKASGIAEDLRLRIEKSKIVLRRQETKITVSIGVATFRNDTSGEDDLIFKADKAMYEAKQKGRNRVCGI